MNLFPWIVGAIIGLLLSIGFVLIKQNISLRQNLAEAAKTVRLQEEVRQLADEAIMSQEQKENEIIKARKQLEKQLEEGACLSGPAHIDFLIRLLDDDAEARCGAATGKSANGVPPAGK